MQAGARHWPRAVARTAQDKALRHVRRVEHVLAVIRRIFSEGEHDQPIRRRQRLRREITPIDRLHALERRRPAVAGGDRQEDALEWMRDLRAGGGAMWCRFLSARRWCERRPEKNQVDTLLHARLALQRTPDRGRRHVEGGAADDDRQRW